MIGEMLNASIMAGDEPEDMLQGVVGKIPDEMLKAVAQYDIEDILNRIREVHPNSAIFTPGGLTFTRTVFNQLRAIANS